MSTSVAVESFGARDKSTKPGKRKERVSTNANHAVGVLFARSDTYFLYEHIAREAVYHAAETAVALQAVCKTWTRELLEPEMCAYTRRFNELWAQYQDVAHIAHQGRPVQPRGRSPNAHVAPMASEVETDEAFKARQDAWKAADDTKRALSLFVGNAFTTRKALILFKLMHEMPTNGTKGDYWRVNDETPDWYIAFARGRCQLHVRPPSQLRNTALCKCAVRNDATALELVPLPAPVYAGTGVVVWSTPLCLHHCFCTRINTNRNCFAVDAEDPAMPCLAPLRRHVVAADLARSILRVGGISAPFLKTDIARLVECNSPASHMPTVPSGTVASLSMQAQYVPYRALLRHHPIDVGCHGDANAYRDMYVEPGCDDFGRGTEESEGRSASRPRSGTGRRRLPSSGSSDAENLLGPFANSCEARERTTRPVLLCAHTAFPAATATVQGLARLSDTDFSRAVRLWESAQRTRAKQAAFVEQSNAKHSEQQFLDMLHYHPDGELCEYATMAMLERDFPGTAAVCRLMQRYLTSGAGEAEYMLDVAMAHQVVDAMAVMKGPLARHDYSLSGMHASPHAYMFVTGLSTATVPRIGFNEFGACINVDCVGGDYDLSDWRGLVCAMHVFDAAGAPSADRAPLVGVRCSPTLNTPVALLQANEILPKYEWYITLQEEPLVEITGEFFIQPEVVYYVGALKRAKALVDGYGWQCESWPTVPMRLQREGISASSPPTPALMKRLTEFVSTLAQQLCFFRETRGFGLNVLCNYSTRTLVQAMTSSSLCPESLALLAETSRELDNELRPAVSA